MTQNLNTIIRPNLKAASKIWFLLGVVYFLICAIFSVDTLVTIALPSEPLFPFEALNTFFFLLLNLAMFMFVFLMPSKTLLKLSKFPSWHELYEYEENQRKIANKPIPLGSVVTVTIQQGCFFSSSTSTIETERGFYRVYGDVGSVDRGVPISKVMNTLYIGVANNEKCFDLR